MYELQLTSQGNRGSGDGVKEVKHFSDGSWYRLYNDGWIEQGGIAEIHLNTEDFVIPLVKPMKNSNYNLLVTPNKILTVPYWPTLMWWVTAGYTTTSFTFSHNIYNAGLPGLKMYVNWYVCGFAA